MLDWTDRHCRYLHRIISRHVVLYTEMITASALLNGRADRLLDHNSKEHPVVLQIGGSNPEELAISTKMALQAGYGEINLNVGCPSDRVQSGRFGACLMKEPELVAACLSAMCQQARGAEISVKCRIGVDNQDPYVALPNFIKTVRKTGVKRIIIHARKAWLQGLSPKQNRNIPPLDYDIVYKMKEEFPDMVIEINGGISDINHGVMHLEKSLDGIMFGRAAYHHPMKILASIDQFYDCNASVKSPQEVVRAMLPYIENHLEQGGRLNQITRHMLGLFSAQPGSRRWKRHLSQYAHEPNSGTEVIEQALARGLEMQ